MAWWNCRVRRGGLPKRRNGSLCCCDHHWPRRFGHLGPLLNELLQLCQAHLGYLLVSHRHSSSLDLLGLVLIGLHFDPCPVGVVLIGSFLPPHHVLSEEGLPAVLARLALDAVFGLIILVFWPVPEHREAVFPHRGRLCRRRGRRTKLLLVRWRSWRWIRKARDWTGTVLGIAANNNGDLDAVPGKENNSLRNRTTGWLKVTPHPFPHF